MLTPKRCLFLHRWRVVLDTGATRYSECRDCKSRRIRQRPGAGELVNLPWLCGLADADALKGGRLEA